MRPRSANGMLRAGSSAPSRYRARYKRKEEARGRASTIERSRVLLCLDLHTIANSYCSIEEQRREPFCLLAKVLTGTLNG